MNDKNNNTSSPPASSQALFEGLSNTGKQLIEGIVGSLGAMPQSDSTELLRSLTAGLRSDQQHFAELQQSYYRQHLELWTNLLRTEKDAPAAPVAVPDPGDRRFHAPEWKKLPYFDYLKQAYLINSRWLPDMLEPKQLPDPAKKKLRFFAKQLIDAAAPVN